MRGKFDEGISNINLACNVLPNDYVAFMKWSEFYFILMPSKLDGVGVFATIDIEEGVAVSDPHFLVRTLKKKEVPLIFHKYCIHKNDEEFFCPPRFDSMQIGWFINHSDKPNVAILRNRNLSCSENENLMMNPELMTLVTLRKISAGEEILVNYNALGEPDHLKEIY